VPRLALIVQEMVRSVVSGVLFTRHPVDGRHIFVIEAIEGLGDDFVSGRREPRRYYVDPRSGRVIKVEGAARPELSSTHIRDLVKFGKAAKRLFRADQDIEWGIEASDKVFLLQSRNITAHGEDELSLSLDREGERLRGLGVVTSGDVLSDQNVAELLTQHPCRMAFGLFTFIFAHGDGAVRIGRNQMGYEIGSELDTGFFHLVWG
jgi:hypothetical protein